MLGGEKSKRWYMSVGVGTGLPDMSAPKGMVFVVTDTTLLRLLIAR
jgi:hypothetical protein